MSGQRILIVGGVAGGASAAARANTLRAMQPDLVARLSTPAHARLRYTALFPQISSGPLPPSPYCLNRRIAEKVEKKCLTLRTFYVTALYR